MLPIMISIVAAVRRFLKKTARGLSLIADGFEEAVEMQRKAQRKFPFAAE